MQTSDRAHRAHRLQRFLSEAKRRKVYISVVAYIAIAIGVVELGGAIVDALELPPATMQVMTILLMLGFPVVVVLAWIFDITTAGVVRTAALGSSAAAEVAKPRRGVDTAAPPVVPLPDLPHGPALRPREERRDAPAPVGEAEDPLDPDRVQRVALGQLRHELRTPVNAIIGYAEMLLEDVADAAVEAELKRIRAGGRDLIAGIDSALSIERWRAAGGAADTSAFADRAHEELRPAIQSVLEAAQQLVDRCRDDGHDVLVPDLERIVAAAHRLAESSTAPARSTAAVGPLNPRNEALTREVLIRIRPVEPGSLAIEGEGRILVVDDNPMNRDLLLRQLARSGYIVDTAEDGLQALERIAERNYDLILLDVLMPRMDGVETLRRIRSDERLTDVPVLMLSSLDEVDSAIRCLELGAEEYLTKPFEPTLLTARIAANIALRRLRARDRAYSEHVAGIHENLRRLSHAAFPEDVAARVLRGETGIVDATGAATTVALVVPRTARPGAPAALVERLDELANAVCETAQQYGVEAVVMRPYGAVLVVGLPRPVAVHAETAAALTIQLLQRLPHCAAGIHTGAAAGGVIGARRPHYDVWGEAVDTAEALAHIAPASAAVLSPTTHNLVRDRYPLTAGAVAEVPGHGHMRSWLLRADLIVAG